MPDGSRMPVCMLPPALVDRAEKAFGERWPSRRVVAAVNWMMFRQRQSAADLVEVANHYALWCFDKRYYETFSRMHEG